MVADLKLYLNPEAQALQARFRDRTLVSRAMRAVLGGLVSVAYRVSRKRVDAGTGRAVISIRRRYDQYSGRVWTMIKPSRALSIDQGRAAGEFVPLRQLINWTESVGHPRSARQVQQMIKQRGAQGTHFMTAARESANAALPGLLQRAAKRIAKQLATGQA